MTFHEFAKRTERLVTDNSPAILTAWGVTGVVTTAYLTGKASFKAAELIAREDEDRFGYDSGFGPTKEKIKFVWKLYIPAAGTGIITIACVIAANRIGTSRTAAMAAAYTISERAYSEYKEKVVEQIGKNKEQKVRDEIAQDRVRSDSVDNNTVIITGGGDVLCYELYTGRYFMSSMETLKKAQNDVNYMILNNFYASLGDFYDKIGLSRTKYSEDLGWNSDKMLELKFSTTMSDDDRPCLALDFSVEPIRGYSRVH